MYIAGFDVSAPVSGLLTIIAAMSRPPTVLPSEMYLRNFGYAFSSVRMSAWSSATSCQRLKSSFTL